MKSLFDLLLRVAMFLLITGAIGAGLKTIGIPIEVGGFIGMIGAVLLISFLASGENW